MRSEVQIVFRAMKEDSNGKPLTGRSARTLGVRICGPRIDIPIRVWKGPSPDRRNVRNPRRSYAATAVKKT